MTRRSQLLFCFVLFGILAACLSACVAPATVATQPVFDPMKAFAGRSDGNGMLSVILQVPQPFHVESRGFAQTDGMFRLDQTITFAGKLPKKRHWLLEKTSPTTYVGTLSDAESPVEGHIKGSQFDLVYSLSSHLTMHQTLTLEPGGKIIDNVGQVTFMGIQIGYMHETIERKILKRGGANS